MTHTAESWRNYAHEVVADVMHAQVPNLITAQRARYQAEEMHDELIKMHDELINLRAERDALKIEVARINEVCRANQSTVDIYKAERDALRATMALIHAGAISKRHTTLAQTEAVLSVIAVLSEGAK
mgnify:CR=1 FL=1